MAAKESADTQKVLVDKEYLDSLRAVYEAADNLIECGDLTIWCAPKGAWEGLCGAIVAVKDDG